MLLIKKREKIDFNDDNSLIQFINKKESDLYESKDNKGNRIIVGIEKGIGLRISTYQSNGWIRINDYYIDKEENKIIRTETYEKGEYDNGRRIEEW